MRDMLHEMGLGVRRLWALPWPWKAAIAAALLVTALIVIGASTGGTGPSSRPDGEKSAGYKLAVIDAGRPLAEDAITVRRAETLLDSLASKCRESRERIADMAVVARDELRRKGIDQKLLTILRNTDYATPPEATGISCVGIFAAYVALQG